MARRPYDTVKKTGYFPFHSPSRLRSGDSYPPVSGF